MGDQKPDPAKELERAEAHRGKAPCVRASEDKGVTKTPPPLVHEELRSAGSQRGLVPCMRKDGRWKWKQRRGRPCA